MKPRKWRTEINAWADGEQVQQCLINSSGEWKDCKHTPSFTSTNHKFRVKPEDPEWMPKKGDLVLVWDIDETAAYARIFRMHDKTANYPWLVDIDYCRYAKPHPLQQERDSYRYAKPHPLQQERNKYRAALVETRAKLPIVNSVHVKIAQMIDEALK